MISFLRWLVLSSLMVPSLAYAQLHERAKIYVPVIMEQSYQVWATLDHPDVIAGLIEKETCITMKHSYCWNPNAKFETAREYGFGLGMFTKTQSFNVFEELKGQDSDLKDWKWDDRFDAQKQIRGISIKLRNDYLYIKKSTNKEDDTWKFTLSAYNGGRGYVLKDIKLCKATQGCDPDKWFNNVENTSTRSKTKWKGYGLSAFDINRQYVDQIWNVKRQKYCLYMNDNFDVTISCYDK